MKRILAVSVLAMCASVALALLQAPTPTPYWQASTAADKPVPLPTPKAAATPKLLTVDNRASRPILEFRDNGYAVVVRDADIPVGPCNLGDLVRAAKAYRDFIKGPANETDPWSVVVKKQVAAGRLLDDLVARCSPASKGGGK